MSSTKYKIDMKRKQMGSLTINNKCYPIYEGLNVIGRDIKATVLLKDVKFSKQHAVISVVDENTHFLSDFGSSNGTRLGNKCLIPYQLYLINDQERITFSDVLCLYHKITESNKVLSNLSVINEELSKSAQHDAETQILPVENKVLSSEVSNKASITCTNDSQDVHLAFTQKILNVHDAPTQNQLQTTISDKQVSVAPSVKDDFIQQVTQDCDMPTQMLDIVQKSSDATTNPSKQNKCKFVTSTQDDFSRTECYDDVFANETFRLSVNKQSIGGIEVDETVLVDKSSITMECDDEKEVMLNTKPVSQWNKSVGAVTEAEICVERVENPTKSVVAEIEVKSVADEIETVNNDDDSDTDIEKSNNKKNGNLVRNTDNNASDDSETDVESNINKKNRQVKCNGDDSETENKNVKRKKLRKTRSKTSNQISDDSETDIECSSKGKSNKKKVKKLESDSETDMDDKPSEMLKTAASASINEPSALNNVVNIVDSGSETEIEDANELLLKITKPESTKSTATNGTVTGAQIPEQDVKHEWSSSDEEIDLLAPEPLTSDSFTDKNSPEKLKTNEILEVKTNNNNNSSIQAKLNADDGFEDDDFDLLVPTQLLETACVEGKSAEEKMAEAPTQLVPFPANKEETLADSLAPTQLLEPVIPTFGKKTDEEINSEAPTQLLEPVKTSSSKGEDRNEETQAPKQLLQSLASTCKVNDQDDYLAETQLLEPAACTKVSNEENEEVDSLAPTQLLQPVQASSGDEIPIDEAETQMVDDIQISTGANEENEDLDLLAPTQLLKPEGLSSKQTGEDEGEVDYLAPTQLLHLDAKSVDNEAKDDEEILDNVFLAPTQNLAMQSTPNAKRSSMKQVEREENDEDFLAPTQKLAGFQKSPKKNVSFSEDIFAAPTQILPGNEEHSIFTAPTQKLTPRKSLGMKRRLEENQDDDEDDDFMAPTQLLTTNKNDRKLPEEDVELDFSINDDPNYINIDYSSEDTSMKLAISYSDDKDFCAPTQKLELSKNNNDEEKTTKLAPSKLLSEPETQFEVEFDLETQKLYVEAATSRPNNPLANMFGEENTQLTETEDQMQAVPIAGLQTGTDSGKAGSSNIETSDSSFQEGSKKRSFEEDVEEMSDKSSKNVKLAQNDVINNTRRTSKRAETINSKYAKTNMTNKNDEVISSPKKRGKKVEEKSVVNKTSSLEEDVTSVPSTSKTKPMVKISDTDEKSSENKPPETPRRMSRRGGRVTEERELETPRKTPARRVKKVIDEEKHGAEMLKELMQANKSPEVKVMLTKMVAEDVRSTEESITVVPEDKVKIEYKKPADEQPVPKRQTRRTKKSEMDVKIVSNTRTTRNKSNSNEESSDGKSSKQNISELGDFVSKTTKKPQVTTRKTRGKQVKKTVDDDDEDEAMLIEDSDDSTNSNIEKYIRKKVLKIDYTDESCSGSSAASVVVPNPRHNKRSLKIEDYSSDEKSTKNTCTTTYLDTPNTKRRRYEPLNITTINTSQTSNPDNGPNKHKIVFTMLNNPELETTVKSLGGTTIDSVYACTVLVTNKISRSLKFLIAVSLGKPIVNTNWISESVKQKMFLDPWNYLLEDAESESKFKISLSESLQRARIKKLLTGYTILLAVNKNFDVLKEIIETCGGKCVTRAPAKSAGANVVVVAYEDEKAKYSRYLKQKTPLTVVAAEAIFSGVLAQELNFDNHVLS